MARELLLSDKIYIAKFYEFDGVNMLALEMNLSSKTITIIYNDMIKKGELEKYRKMNFPLLCADWGFDNTL